MTVAREDSSRRIDSVLEKAARGARLDLHDAIVLLGAEGEHFDSLLAASAALRDEGLVRVGRPGVITYSRKVFLPITTLCRDRCHYCAFVDTPGQLLKQNKSPFMSRAQIVSIARQGAALGCKEALFTLGDRPEDRWPQAREWLSDHGYSSTIDYVGAMAQAVLDETGLLPHLNPGVMTKSELEALRPFAPSMGMMLETTSTALFTEKGAVHYGSPDKDPALRLQVIDDAGAAHVPFTTGILLGLGETLSDRAESLIALRAAHEKHGHIQEVIVQNFRAKPRTAMQTTPDLEHRDYARAVAVARLVMGKDARIQVPPNLSDATEFALLIRAGIDDWGGVSPLTADHVNPERPWPHLDDLRAATAAAGFQLRERLTAHTPYLADHAQWIDPQLYPSVSALLDPATGLANEGAIPTARNASPAVFSTRLSGVRAALSHAENAPEHLSDRELETLLSAEGDDLNALAQLANDVRRSVVGESLSYVVNRNLSSTLVAELSQVDAVARDAAALGATELCIQGLAPRGVSAQRYLELARTATRAAPGLHLHAFRPADVRDFAHGTGLSISDAILALRDAGVDTMPGTGVKILDDSVQQRIAPEDIPVSEWLQIIETAHRLGVPTSSVMFYGHGESGAHRIAHLRALTRLQSEHGGFTEFVPIPLPGYDIPLVAGRSMIDEHRAMHAVSRIALHGFIRHIQTPWTRLGLAASAIVLASGADDLGGALLDGRVFGELGVEFGHELRTADASRIAGQLFRTLRQRTTTYGEPAAAPAAPSASGSPSSWEQSA